MVLDLRRVISANTQSPRETTYKKVPIVAWIEREGGLPVPLHVQSPLQIQAGIRGVCLQSKSSRIAPGAFSVTGVALLRLVLDGDGAVLADREHVAGLDGLEEFLP